jgi:hypothetical protein
MPLKHGYSKGAVAHNIKVEQEMGRPHNQAVAIALQIRDAELRKRAMNANRGNQIVKASKLPHW